jgi:hypothetical protein
VITEAVSSENRASRQLQIFLKLDFQKRVILPVYLSNEYQVI